MPITYFNLMFIYQQEQISELFPSQPYPVLLVYDSCINPVSSAVITCNLNSKESHKGCIQQLFTILFVSHAAIKHMWVRFLIGTPCLNNEVQSQVIWFSVKVISCTYHELHVSYSLEAWNDMEYHHDTFQENPKLFPNPQVTHIYSVRLQLPITLPNSITVFSDGSLYTTHIC